MTKPGWTRRHAVGVPIGALLGATMILGVVTPALVGAPAGASTTPTTTPATCGPLVTLLGGCKAPASVGQPADSSGVATTTPSTVAVPSSTAASSSNATSSPATTTTTTPDAPVLHAADAAATSNALASSACSGTTPPVAAPSGQWQCTLDDEFNGSSLNTNTWAPTLTSISNLTSGPSGAKVCYVNNPNTVSESGGYLNLTVLAVAKSFACKKMTGAAITTRYEGGMVNSMGLFDQEFGYFQVRAELPASSIPGLQETLWLYPEDETLYGPWPDSGEIDYGEFYSEYPKLDVPVVHYPGSTRDPNATNQNCSLAGQNTSGQFHTYAVLWTPTTITTYYDGTACMTDTYGPHVTNPDKAPEPFNQPFFLTFTAALGYGAGNTFSAAKTPLPATTRIDWARVWQY